MKNHFHFSDNLFAKGTGRGRVEFREIGVILWIVRVFTAKLGFLAGKIP